MWYTGPRSRRRRKAIKQSEIRKKFRSMGPFVEGVRAFRDAEPGDILTCPYDPDSSEEKAWLAGVDFRTDHEKRRQEIRRYVSQPRQS